MNLGGFAPGTALESPAKCDKKEDPVKKPILGFGFAAALALLPLGSGQALAQDGFIEPADAPSDFIVTEPPEIVGLEDLTDGPLIIYGAYASVGDVVADAPDVIVPLGDILGSNAIGDADIVITDADAG